MSQDLHHLETWAAGLLQQLAPAARKRLALDIARTLRRCQASRIAAQQDPDGTPYTPRKPRLREKAGRVKRQKMFAKLRTARHLTVKATQDAAIVGFRGRAARIAEVHQYGGADAVVANGPRARYPRRVLLGFTRQDQESIRDRIVDVLSR